MIVLILQILLAAAAVALSARWFAHLRSTKTAAGTSPAALGVGAVANFFDTLGIGSFAPTTAAIKFFKLTKDELIPGTLNVGHAIPTIAQALIFIAFVLAVFAACRWLWVRLRMPLPQWLWLVPPYAIGGIASYWVYERIATF